MTWLSDWKEWQDSTDSRDAWSRVSERSKEECEKESPGKNVCLLPDSCKRFPLCIHECLSVFSCESPGIIVFFLLSVVLYCTAWSPHGFRRMKTRLLFLMKVLYSRRDIRLFISPVSWSCCFSSSSFVGRGDSLSADDRGSYFSTALSFPLHTLSDRNKKKTTETEVAPKDDGKNVADVTVFRFPFLFVCFSFVDVIPSQRFWNTSKYCIVFSGLGRNVSTVHFLKKSSSQCNLEIRGFRISSFTFYLAALVSIFSFFRSRMKLQWNNNLPVVKLDQSISCSISTHLYYRLKHLKEALCCQILETLSPVKFHSSLFSRISCLKESQQTWIFCWV